MLAAAGEARGLKTETYISVDIEADGPIPGPYSMVSFGMTVAGRMTGKVFEPIDAESHTLYAELKPISDDQVPESLAVSGLDREALIREGLDPAEAMRAAAAWIGEVCGNSTPVLAAFRSPTTGCGSTGTSCASPGLAVRAFTLHRHQDALRRQGGSADRLGHQAPDAQASAFPPAAHPQRA